MTRRWFHALGAPGLVVLLSAAPSLGQSTPPKKEASSRPAAESGAPKTRSLGTAGAWSAYAAGDKASPICYLVGRPQKVDSAGIARQAPVAMVTHRPSENITNVVSFVEGYTLKAGSKVTLDVDDRKFDLFTNDDSAWARTAELDRTIVAAFINGRTATVQGMPNSGKPTTDIYSLSGFTKALALIDEACGINRPETAAARQADPAPQPQAATPQPVAAPAKAATAGRTSARKTSTRRASQKATTRKKATQTQR